MNAFTYELMEPYRFSTARWTGGSTTELLILPEDSSYTARDFSARISSATVELERSVFTPLPGIKRFISPIEGRMTLRVEGAESVTLTPGDVYSFEGGVPVECEGTARDINLMLRGIDGSMEYAQTAELEKPWQYYIFAPEAASLTLNSTSMGLPGGYLLRISPARGVTVSLEASRKVYIMKITV